MSAPLAANKKPTNEGEGSMILLLNSGWNCVAKKNGWSGISNIVCLNLYFKLNKLINI